MSKELKSNADEAKLKSSQLVYHLEEYCNLSLTQATVSADGLPPANYDSSIQSIQVALAAFSEAQLQDASALERIGVIFEETDAEIALKVVKMFNGNTSW